MNLFFKDWFSRNLAIDLGTSSTLILERNNSIAINEPSIVAVEKSSCGKEDIIAVGNEAKNMLGKTPKLIKSIKPVKQSVIADFDATSAMLKYFFGKILGGRHTFIKPKIIIGVGAEITEVEKKAVKDSAEFAQAGQVLLVREAFAAALGAGLSVKDSSGEMIVDIGGGTTKISVISCGGLVFSHSSKIGGNQMDQAIIKFIKTHYSLLIGETTAEKVKLQLGSAFPLEENISMQIQGRDIISGIPKTITVDNHTIVKALSKPINIILDSIKTSLEKTPPEISSDIYDKGIFITGGGALLKNFDTLLSRETGLNVHLSKEPICGTVMGFGQILSQPNFYADLLESN